MPRQQPEASPLPPETQRILERLGAIIARAAEGIAKKSESKNAS